MRGKWLPALAALAVSGALSGPRAAPAGPLIGPVPQEELDHAYDFWNFTLDRVQEVTRSVAPSPAPLSESEAPLAEDQTGENVITIGGRSIRMPSRPSLGATSPAGEAGATEQIAQPAGEAPPALVTIKTSKMVEGKIITVEVQVTPTPAPRGEASATEEVTAPVLLSPELAALRDKLKVASEGKGEATHFTNKEIGTLLSVFMKERSSNPEFDKLITAKQAENVQSRLQRLASAAQGGVIPAPIAKLLSQALFRPKTRAAGARPPVPLTPQGLGAADPNHPAAPGARSGISRVRSRTPQAPQDRSARPGSAPPAGQDAEVYQEEQPLTEGEVYSEDQGEYYEEGEGTYSEGEYEEEQVEEEATY